MQSTADPQELTKIRRRGVTRSSITCLEKGLCELEAILDQPTTADHGQELTVKLETLDVDFKSYHLQLVDLLDEVEDQKLSSRKLTHLKKGIITARDAITALSIDHDDVSLIEQYEAKLSDKDRVVYYPYETIICR